MSPTPDRQSDASRPQGISLDELTEAFAQAMGTRPRGRRPVEEEPAADAPERVEGPTSGDQAEPDQLPPQEQEQQYESQSEDASDDACPISPRTILEAMLFVGDREGQPLTAARAAELMRGVEPDDVPALVDELNRRYAANGCPYHLVGEDAGYRLTLRKAYHSLRSRFYGRIREARLSQLAIDVLAIVAYQQPITADELKRLRGKPCNHVLSQLVRRGLLRIERQQGKPRLTHYLTTDRFLELFGMETLEDLPRSAVIES